MTVCYPHAASHPAPHHRPTDRPVPPGLLAAAGRAAVSAWSHPTGGRSGRAVHPPAPGGDLPDRRGGPERDLPGTRIPLRAPRRGAGNLRLDPAAKAAEAATGPRAGASVALRAAPGQAPSAQAPARPGAGGAAMRHIPSTQSAAAAAPIAAARFGARPAAAPAPRVQPPAKKSPIEACDDARPYCSIFATIGRPIAAPSRAVWRSRPLRLAAWVSGERGRRLSSARPGVAGCPG
jgi:hypothetical protein